MQKFIQLLLAATLSLSLSLASKSLAATDIGGIIVKNPGAAIPVRITVNSPELQKLAQVAFDAHGCYKVVGGGQAYDFKFTVTSGNIARVDVLKGSTSI